MSRYLKIRNRTFAAILSGILPFYLSGQNRLVGHVFDKDRISVMAANVYNKNNPIQGTITDINGKFELPTSDIDTLAFSCLGYNTVYIPFNQFVAPFEVILHENTLDMDEVVIVADLSVTKEFSIKELDRISVYTSPISGGDPLKAISILPYSTNTSESANPELRGSSGDYSRVIVNNVPVYSPIKNTQLNGMGNFSLLNTELIDNQLVYAGNPPLKYGNSIAGLVEISTMKELKSSNQLKLALSLANMGFMYSNKVTQNSFVQLYGNHQFSSAYLPLNGNNSSFIKDFSSTDAGLNYRLKASNHFFVNVYSYIIKENFNSDNTMYNYYGNLKADSKRNFNIVNFDYHKQNFAFSLNNGTNFSQSNFNFGNFDIQQGERQVYSSVDSKYYFSSSFTVQAGISHDYTKENYINTLPYYHFAIFPTDTSYHFTNNTHNHNIETYLYGKFNLGDFIIGTGLRKNIPVENQADFISYQANVKYNINEKNSFILSGGKYNGYTIPNYTIERFHHVSSSQMAFDYLFHTNQLSLNVSVYSKMEKQPVYYQELGQEHSTDLKISGAELSFDYTINNFNITGSYVWLDSKMNKGDEWFKATNDMNCLLKSSISYFSEKWVNTSLTFTLHPGLYYTPVINSEYNFDAKNYKPIYGNINSAQHNTYSSTDLTFNKIMACKSSNIVAFLTISNLFNKSNHEAPVYNHDYSVKDFWLFQKRLLYFGVMITL
jgi:hypothetical protein